MATGARSASELASDGRVRRGERSGQAIVEALVGLVGDGILEPTAQQVAARAGARVVIVNASPTPYDALADVVLREPIGTVLPSLVKV